MLRALCPTGAEREGGCAEANNPCAYFTDRTRCLAQSPLQLSPLTRGALAGLIAS